MYITKAISESGMPIQCVQCTVYTLQYTLYSVQCTLYNVYCTLYTVHIVQVIISVDIVSTWYS